MKWYANTQSDFALLADRIQNGDPSIERISKLKLLSDSEKALIIALSREGKIKYKDVS